MLIRTIKVDVEKYLEDLWLLFSGDITASFGIATNKDDLIDLIREDKVRVKDRLEVLKDIGVIDQEEYNNMSAKIDKESVKVIESFNETA